MESLHCNFHNVENSNCTYHIVDNITRCFPHSGNSPRWALKGPFGGHECPRGCPGLYYYYTKISKKVLPIVENVLWKKDVHRSCKKWENYKVQLKGPIRCINGPRVGFDTMGFNSCVHRAHWRVFCCLKCKNTLIIGDCPSFSFKNFNAPLGCPIRLVFKTKILSNMLTRKSGSTNELKQIWFAVMLVCPDE